MQITFILCKSTFFFPKTRKYYYFHHLFSSNNVKSISFLLRIHQNRKSFRIFATVFRKRHDILDARFPIEFAPQKWIKSKTTSKKLRLTA